MTANWLVPIGLIVVSIAICGGPGSVDTTEAESKLRSGDLPAAAEAYDSLGKDNPDDVGVAIGQAYVQMLAGDYEKADDTLEKVEAKDPEKTGEIKLRRALVALRAGNLDDVKKHGKESGLPAGLVLAAEVHLADAEPDDAIPLLKEAQSEPGAVGDTARSYLEMYESGDTLQQGLAEATALWALHQRDTAVDSAEEIVKALPEDQGKAEQLLLWAGRAATSGRPGTATSLLDELDVLGAPPGQEWRIRATRALVRTAEGQYDEAREQFATLDVLVASGGAPWQGVQDAKATAAALSADKAFAKELVGDGESAASARGLMAAGAVPAAKGVAPAGGSLASFLESN